MKNDDLDRLIRAQLEYVQSQVTHYLDPQINGVDVQGRMPHQWGSRDSAEYLTGALGIAEQLMSLLYNEDEKRDLKTYLREEFVLTYAYSADCYAEAVWEFGELSKYLNELDSLSVKQYLSRRRSVDEDVCPRCGAKRMEDQHGPASSWCSDPH